MTKAIIFLCWSLITSCHAATAKSPDSAGADELSRELKIIDCIAQDAKSANTKFPSDQERRRIKCYIATTKSPIILQKLALHFDYLWRSESAAAPILAGRLECGFWACAELIARKSDPESQQALQSLRSCRDGAGSMRLSDLISVQKGIKTFEFYTKEKSEL